MTQWPKRVQQWFVRNRAIRTAQVLLVVASACTTASLGMVLQDALAKPGHPPAFLWYRWLALVLGLGGVVLFVGWRTRAQRLTGTLFYVQMLDESMTDRRITALHEAAKNRLARRSITRWLDLDGCRVNGVIDVHTSCHEAGAALEERMNIDRDDTANTVVPNALWPIALSLGMNIPVGGPDNESVTVLELPDEDPDAGEEEFRLEQVEVPEGAPLVPEDLSGAAGGRIGVWLAFTKRRKHFTVEKFRQFGVSTAYTVWPETFGINVDMEKPRYDAEALKILASGAARELAALKQRHRGREFVIVAMISKSVALAVGWHLAQMEVDFFRNTHLMNYDQKLQRLITMRVRPSQPLTAPVAGEVSDAPS